MREKVVILGGGISGLSLAYFLRQLPASARAHIRVLESQAHAGGWVRTAQRHGFLFEEGPRGFRPSRNGAEVLRLVEQLNLQHEMRAVDASARARYILHHGRVEKVPTRLMELLRWPLTWDVTKAAVHEVFAKKGSGQDESIYDFAARRFSPVVAERLLDPVASGIFGGDIRKLSVQACFKLLTDLEGRSGSIIRSMLFHPSPKVDTLLDGSTKSAFVRQHEQSLSISFASGMGTIIQALQDALEGDCSTSLEFRKDVVAIERSPGHSKMRVVVRDVSADAEEVIEADQVYATIPAFGLAKVMKRSFADAAAALEEIRFVPMGMAHVGFNDAVLKSDGFGYLIPSCEGERVLGVVYDSNAFPMQNDISQTTQTRLTVMAGGAHFPEISQMPQEALEELALDALKRHLGITAQPDFLRAMVLRDCIPQYHVGFDQTVKRIQGLLPQGLHLGGNSYFGVGLADCINHSKKLALEYGQTK